jgi:hypothetical protein
MRRMELPSRDWVYKLRVTFQEIVFAEVIYFDYKCGDTVALVSLGSRRPEHCCNCTLPNVLREQRHFHFVQLSPEGPSGPE